MAQAAICCPEACPPPRTFDCLPCGIAPREVQIDIALVSNVCTACTNLNDSYVLPFVEPSGLETQCRWRLDLDTALVPYLFSSFPLVCQVPDEAWIELVTVSSGPSEFWDVIIFAKKTGVTQELMSWRGGTTAATVCVDWDETSFTRDPSSHPACDFTLSTCKVTALV